MKIGRRGFLGFMGGAVASGPKLAQELATITPGPPMTPYHGEAQHLGVSAAIEGNWKAQRIADLRKLLKFDDPEEARRLRARRIYTMENHARLRLDSMRSIAPQHKFKMLLDGEERRAKVIRRMEWEDELNRLLGLES